MSLTAIMIEQIGAARTIVEDGAEVIPAWRINTPEGTYLVFTRFDHDKPEQRERLLHLMARFMVWKMATSFVLTAETWLGRRKRARATRRCSPSACRTTSGLGWCRGSGRDPVSFGAPEWLMPDQIDETYFRLLPTGASEITAKEEQELAFIFGGMASWRRSG